MAGVRGKDFYLYRNTDEPYDGSPSWALLENVRDLNRELTKALADASTRASTFRMQVSTLTELTVGWQMVYDDADTHLTELEQRFFDNTDQEMLVLDGPIGTAGSRGLRFMGQITSFTVNEALEDMGLVDIEMVPGYAPTNLPRRVEVVTPGSVTDM